MANTSDKLTTTMVRQSYTKTHNRGVKVSNKTNRGIGRKQSDTDSAWWTTVPTCKGYNPATARTGTPITQVSTPAPKHVGFRSTRSGAPANQSTSAACATRYTLSTVTRNKLESYVSTLDSVGKTFARSWIAYRLGYAPCPHIIPGFKSTFYNPAGKMLGPYASIAATVDSYFPKSRVYNR